MLFRGVLFPLALLPLLTLVGSMELSGWGRPEWGGLLLLLHLVVLPPFLWWIGRRLRHRWKADPASRANLLSAAALLVLPAFGLGSGIVGALAMLLLAAIPLVGLWLGLGLHRRDARLT